jgi:inositol transport system ATP-binding protein
LDNLALLMENISKSFPGVKALDDVSFELKKGEVHALMGENGAGKSTLMKILIGLYHQDSGNICVNGKEVKIHSPKDSLNCGISMIHQELNPVPAMSIAENIFLGREPRLFKVGGIVNKKQMNKNTVEFFKTLGLDFNPKRIMMDLSVAETQMVEIAKAISYNSDIIIMDEPTSAITDKEIEKLFNMIALLKSKGVSIIYISHKLEEIFKIADRITVLRDGTYVGTKSIDEVDKNILISMMVGREINNIFPKEAVHAGDVVLSVKGLTKKGMFENISFELKAGEILGIAGLMGAGRTELVETIFGIRKLDKGEIYINGEKTKIKSPRDAIRQGLAIVSEDRKRAGLNLKASVKENITLVRLKEFSRLGIIKKHKEIRSVDESIRKISIKTPSRNQIVTFLSGGNQQKVIIAKWLLVSPEIFILDEPTRGIDVGAKSEIHALITALAKEGKAVIMISSELPEVMGMSDRVIILHEGKITGELKRHEFDQKKIMNFAMGHKEEM